jgi:hypothetical protein
LDAGARTSEAKPRSYGGDDGTADVRGRLREPGEEGGVPPDVIADAQEG